MAAPQKLGGNPQTPKSSKNSMRLGNTPSRPFILPSLSLHVYTLHRPAKGAPLAGGFQVLRRQPNGLLVSFLGVLLWVLVLKVSQG